jgi:hypothetical protein
MPPIGTLERLRWGYDRKLRGRNLPAFFDLLQRGHERHGGGVELPALPRKVEGIFAAGVKMENSAQNRDGGRTFKPDLTALAYSIECAGFS